jgi:hypothetical protein
VAERIRGDVLAGVWGASATLPRTKELAARYGVCRSTAANALNILTAQQFAAPLRRRYTLRRPARGLGAQSAICLVNLKQGRYVRAVPHPDQVGTLLGIEAAATHANLRVLNPSVHNGPRAVVGLTEFLRRQARTGTTILGCALVTRGFTARALGAVIGALKQRRVRTALLDDTGIAGPIVGPTVPATMCLFPVAYTPTCGRQMGTYLLENGHERCAFISFDADDAWVVNRATGLRAAFAEAGCTEGAVQVRALPSSSSFYNMAPVANEFFRSIPRHRDELFGSNHDMLVRAFTGDFGGRVRVAFSESLQDGFLYDRLKPVVTQLLDRRDITAWVCASDTLACLCRRILDRMKVRVPDDVSLVGFDDTFQAHAAGITSYNFNRASIARAMVDFVLQPRWLHLHRGRKQVVEIDGYITRRSSVGVRS